MRPCLLALLAWVAVAASPAEQVLYPRHQAKQDPQQAYALSMLRLTLDKSGHRYELRQAQQAMVQSRAILEIKNHTGKLDILWTMTTPEREAALLPIRIPIDRGLIGWRVALVSSARAGLLGGADSAAGLARFTAGQMFDWPDTAILRGNGLPVKTTSIYEGLFQQLALNRIDYFPRSIIEVQNELAAHRSLGLSIEPKLIIKYPAAFYFFVGKNRPALAADIATGLEKAIADGSFAALFQRHFKAAIDSLDLPARKVLEMKNDALPSATPLGRKELWFAPGATPP